MYIHEPKIAMLDIRNARALVKALKQENYEFYTDGLKQTLDGLERIIESVAATLGVTEPSKTDMQDAYDQASEMV